MACVIPENPPSMLGIEVSGCKWVDRASGLASDLGILCTTSKLCTLQTRMHIFMVCPHLDSEILELNTKTAELDKTHRLDYSGAEEGTTCRHEIGLI